MRSIIKIIFILLLFDMITTIYALTFIPGAYEMNPLLTTYGNVIINVIISHIFVMLVLIWADKSSMGNEKIRRHYDISFIALSVFLGLVVLNNLLGIISYHLVVI